MQTNNKILMLMAVAALSLSCSSNSGKNTNEAPISKPQIEFTGDVMTPELLWSMGRLSDIQLSPDKKTILYGVSYYSITQNKGNRELYVVDLEGNQRKQLTQTAVSEAAAQWSADGKKIFFLSSVSGSSQLWQMLPNGSKPKRLTSVEGGIEAFRFSPDGKKLLYVAQVKYGKRAVDYYPDLDKTSGRIIDDLMYKHWDEWVESIPHPFVADFSSRGLSNVRDLLQDEPFESPMKPWGGIEQLAWSPDGKIVAYTCRKKTGVEYSRSTNSDIYLCYLEENCRSENITAELPGYDTNPVFSPCGSSLAFSSMSRDGYESDKNRLMVYELSTGKMKDLTANFDQEANSVVWSADAKSLYFVSCWHGRVHIYQAFTDGSLIRQITRGDYDFADVHVTGDYLVGLRHSLSQANEIIRLDPQSGEMLDLSRENKAVYDQLKMGKVEERWVKTTDNKEMLVWVVYPPHFDPAKKYPAILYCQGGPQSPVSQFWSFRWNLQLMAAKGYIIVAPNRRGLPGFGQEWLEQISGDYGGQNMKDYLSAIDALSTEAFIDQDRLGCVGASYGGFSVYWLAGNHDKRFKAFISHSGIFNLEQQYLETEEMWFADWDLGGPYWDWNNKTAQNSYANSPHRFVDKWDTPILCIHGEKDYRILASQGMAAFNAAKLRGIPAELLVFPDENHWISKPQNAILWQRRFFNWLDKYLK